MAKSLDEKRNFNVFPKGPLTGFTNGSLGRVTGLAQDGEVIILKENRLLKIGSISRKKGKKVNPNIILLCLQRPDGLGDGLSKDERRKLWRREIFYFCVDKNTFFKCFSFRGNLHQNILLLKLKNEAHAESETDLA